MIMVYAMCGFANFASVGILIAGMSALVPVGATKSWGLP